MKKLIVFLCILFASVLCTACINNFAIQELNSKAKEYLDKGDVASAICRLQSSVDLDGNIYETRYNLAIAYIKNQDYKNAKEQIEVAMRLKPENADTYYSLGVIHEGIAKELTTVKETEEETGEETDNKTDDKTEKISNENIEAAILSLNEAIKAYETYLQKNAEAKDKTEVERQIDSIKKTIEEHEKQLDGTGEEPVNGTEQ